MLLDLTKFKLPRSRRGSRKPPETYSQEQSFQGEGCFGGSLGKHFPEVHPFH